MVRPFILLAAAVLLQLPAVAAPAVDYARDIAPVLSKNCSACHSAANKTSDFSVESQEKVIAGGKKYGKAVVGGHPEKSPIVQLIDGHLTPKMPVGGVIAESEIKLISNWVASLPEEKATKVIWRWPFEKPVKPAVPAVKSASWVANPIDSFVLAKLEGQQLAPAQAASKRTLARRVYFDLIGLPPTPDEVESFIADNSANAYEKLIDKLLADPRYGEKWGRHWLDLVRYGETSGLEGDGAIGNAWRYRDWVIEAFNQDMPYDRFVLKQLAGGDEHSKTRNNYQPDIQGFVPLGFYRVAPWDRSNLVADEVRQNYLNEITTTVGSVFLGLSVGCARCHDHKYDPIPTKDYYRLQAFFNAIQVDNVEVPYKDPDFAEQAEKQIKHYQELIKDGPEKKALDQLEKELLVKLIADRKKKSAGKELTSTDLRLELKIKPLRIFTKAEHDRHADLLEDATRTGDAEERKALDDYEAQLMTKLKAAYAEGKVDPLARFDTLTAEDVRSEAARREKSIFSKAELDKHVDLTETLEVYRRRLGRWQPTALTIKNVPGPPNGPNLPLVHVLNRGDYRQPKEAVEAGFLTSIVGKEESPVIEQDRYRQFPTRGWRLTLAKWIASPDNPQTARVMVNRIWQHHFGTGIVATPSDFGANGERPTNPELLDWMAHQFIDSGWSIKAMHRLILTSNTYKQSADNPTFVSNKVDPDNKLLWHFPRRRLLAEEIRDSLLYVAGKLNTERGGPSVFPPLPSDLADFARYGRGGGLMWEPNEKPEDARRRSVYTFQRRSMPLPMMASFDAPVFSESCERRSQTTTALQALSLLNGELIHDEAAELAKRAEAAAPGNRAAQISKVFEYTLNRKPQQDELDKFSKFSGNLESLCRIVLTSNEFLYVD